MKAGHSHILFEREFLKKFIVMPDRGVMAGSEFGIPNERNNFRGLIEMRFLPTRYRNTHLPSLHPVRYDSVGL